ncbi:MAG TPA: hypothetical protein VIU86_20010 [Gaiellaceae bacterium]
MSDPGPTPTPSEITIDTLIAEFNDLAQKRDAKAAAHAATLARSQDVITAQALQSQAVTAESDAADSEETVFAQLKADLDAFKAATP